MPSSAEARTSGEAPLACACFHCGEPVPAGSDFYVQLSGRQEPMCCPGCQAVASMIAGAGMDRFYQQRTALNERPVDWQTSSAERFSIYDDPELAASFTQPSQDASRTVSLLIGGMTCAACTWLIENSLRQLPAVRKANVNLARSRLDVLVDADIKNSEIFARVSELGYRVQPFRSTAQLEQARAEHRHDMRRLGVAGLGMMQVGMFAIALHAGDLQGIAQDHQALLRWVSLLVASFVVLFSARPFFESAWRHLKVGALVMDLPVALAIGLAWCASLWATLTGTGQVYFDSVVMFTFLLLLARFIEKRLRLRDALQWFEASDSLPDRVQVRRNDQWEVTPRERLHGGELILVPAGEIIAVDATIITGNSAVREDTFNGEPLPRSVSAGDQVFAGTLNMEQSLRIRALGSYRDSRLAALQRSIDSAKGDKPRLAQIADRIAGWFIAGILLATTSTFLVWQQIDPDRAFWISLSVLVISCPCALALATPAALANGASVLRRMGVLVHGDNALETLSRCTNLVFDKTGTLSAGSLELHSVSPVSGWSAQEATAIAAAMQRHSSHPAASAFTGLEEDARITDVNYIAGAGLEAQLDSHTIRLGSETYCRALLSELPSPPDDLAYWVALTSSDGSAAWFALDDRLRPEAPALVEALRCTTPCALAILSGDRQARVDRAAQALGIEQASGELSPAEKLSAVKKIQRGGGVVCMIGDGLNDAPVLGAADTSIAVAGATELARTQADFVVMNGNLDAITLTWQHARRVRAVLHQNIAWALGYNTAAIPLAALGYIPPWAAALGMSLSSLLVVGNSLRLRSHG